ncbi:MULTISPECIES: hypothetical protein [unclassified Streptomyces]|uniref:hypothetical protein n=1 Tax=unclassified Streptomyces TaxID=2593676 RepID=UPI002DD7B963|nr:MULTISPECIES: hypothetical protein [unclassified Streptomyces]WSA96882.1 hypothetical protein OIE63_39010 [Streptomyces sp. NBC_01795]WSB81299.1 hypothetical protein OHB04_40130 [Streptomyces sp. NBC_01775]WSS10492.1 hypothetical protein OG533_00135 [Streptomyces sp. NBC_01186]WSS39187.1 hypothetical protein OG220_00150 [Streptomyces sp. NBC_01187]
MRTRLVTALAATAISTTLLTAPAAHAQTQAASIHYRLEYGNTWSDGTITFYNRAVTIAGVHRSVSAANVAAFRNTEGETRDAAGKWMEANGNPLSQEASAATKSFRFSIPANAPGGAAKVRVCLTDGYHKRLKCQLVSRPS